MPGAKNFCQKTCGGCEGEEESCSVPTSATYTSDVTSAQVGEVVQFECADGYLYVSGPLQRMCGPGGELLGSEPVCEASPKFQDVNLKHVRQRPAQLKFRQGFLLDHDGYRVPMAGEISEWYYYCGNEGRLDFVVYRKDGSGTFQYVGSNNVTCEAGFKLRHLVPAADRISVKPDDAVGVHTSGHDTLSINACKGSIKLVEPLIASPQKTVDVTKLDFAKRGCLYPSVGFRVES
ncbi:uncharacterized protein LOC101858002 [Aplysia californica]|uniref:Uncharacterized protein LOC101858002 n=1 Tax=Aplysia californica TaxID=6500 RepID=A0ABM1AF00_APLCA|nr:uncharacterized protein LOC101858002 [Aplysia californica]